MEANPLIRGVIAAGILAAYYGVISMATQAPATDAPTSSMAEEHALAVKSDELYKAHEYEKARPMLEKLHSEFPDNHIYLSRLATIYEAAGQTEKEIAALEKFMQVAPSPEDACPEIGDAYRRIGKGADAIHALERCVAVSPTSDLIFYLGHAYERESMWAKAGQVYQRGLDQSPDYPDLRLGLARTQMRMGNIELAKKNTDSVLEKSPDNSDALLLAGMIAKRNGDLPSAMKYYTHGTEVAPTYTDIFRELARTAEDVNDRPTALKSWQHVLQLAPDDAAARRGVARLQGAS